MNDLVHLRTEHSVFVGETSGHIFLVQSENSSVHEKDAFAQRTLLGLPDSCRMPVRVQHTP